MSKPKPRADSPLPLLALIQEAEARLRTPDAPEGSLDVSCRLRAELAAALKACPLSRFEVAGRMSALLGRQISKDMLDAWTATCESHQVHRFPLEYLPAFQAATGARSPLELVARAAGCFCLPGPDALRAELQRIDEEMRRLKAESQKRRTFLKEMEGKG